MRASIFFFVLTFVFTACNKDAFHVEPQDEISTSFAVEMEDPGNTADLNDITRNPENDDPPLCAPGTPAYTESNVLLVAERLQEKANQNCVDYSREVAFCKENQTVIVKIEAVPQGDCKEDNPVTDADPRYQPNELTDTFRAGEEEEIKPCTPGTPAYTDLNVLLVTERLQELANQDCKYYSREVAFCKENQTVVVKIEVAPQGDCKED